MKPNKNEKHPTVELKRGEKKTNGKITAYWDGENIYIWDIYNNLIGKFMCYMPEDNDNSVICVG